MKKTILTLTSAFGLTFMAQGQATTDIVGYITLDIPAGTANGPTYTYLSASLAQSTAELSTTVSSGTTGSITVGATLSANAYSTANGPFYLVTEDGDIYDVVDNTTSTITLDTSSDLSGLSGKSVKIYKHQTLASVFGADPQSKGVQGAASVSSADQILIFDPFTGVSTTYYYKNAATFSSPFIGWVSSGNINTDASKTIIDPDFGFVYARTAQTDLDLVVSGGVINSNINVPVGEGYNLVSVPYPVDKQLTLSTSGLYDANNFDINKHLKGAASVSQADQVLIRDGNTFKTYFYKDSASFSSPFIGWVESGNINADAGTTPLPQGSFFILRQFGNPPIKWKFNNVVEDNN